MRFGELLQNERVRNRISLRDLGAQIGLSAVYLSDIEKGHRRPPSRQVVVRIAGALGVEPEAFVLSALAERDRVELSLADDKASPLRREAALALLRIWDEWNDDQIDELRHQIEAGRRNP